MSKILQESKKLQEKIVEYRRFFHKHPELRFEEHKTSSIIAEELEKFNIRVKRDIGNIDRIKKELKIWGDDSSSNIGPTGVLGILEGEKEGKGKTILLRADIDALEIFETKNPNHIPNIDGFRSQNEGIMHACGHDAHIAMLLGAAKILSEIRKEIKGEIKFLFQPAEEVGIGAKIMKEAGVLKSTDFVLGMHVRPDLTAGKIMINDGPTFASVDKIRMKIKGGGGHAASPHECKDPISISANIINSIYKMMSREVDSRDPAVLTFTKIKSGTTWNIIPETAEIEGTIRTFDEDISRYIINRTKSIGKSLSDLYKLKLTFESSHLMPSTKNTKRIAKKCRKIARDLFGDEMVVTGKPLLGGEDFAIYLNSVPGSFMFLGTGNEEKGTNPPLHNPSFDVDESVLYVGTALFATLALKIGAIDSDLSQYCS